jgi:2-keto-3-deoxy-L-arabinonate dehydratase
MRISGVCPVLSVPFDDRGALDLPSFRNLVRWVQSLEVQGTRVQSVMLFGVASENHKLRDEEREQLLLALLQERADQPLTIIASVADHSGELAVERAQRYQAIGADAINVLPPSFLSPTKDQVLAHIERVLQSVSVPVVVQHLPQAGGLEDVESLLPLHEAYPHFATIKCEANPPMESVARIAAKSGGRVSTLVGWGGVSWVDGVNAGAIGVQPGCSLTDLYLWAQAALDGNDRPEFARRVARFSTWIREWIGTVENLIAVEKQVLVQRGIIASAYCRMPTVSVTPQVRADVCRAIELAESITIGDHA